MKLTASELKEMLNNPANPNVSVHPTSIDIDDNIWKSPKNDPYHGECVRHDEILHETLTKIFQKCYGGKGSEIRKLFRRNNGEREAIFEEILKQRPALSKILPQKTELPLLWIAVLSCYQKSAELLVRSGADVNERCKSKLDYYSEEKTTILHMLLWMFPSAWNERFMSLVTDHGANLQTQDTRGQTVLHLAVNRGRVDITKMLLEKGAEVNAADNDGEIPLLAAAIHSKADELVPLLVEHGADVAVKNRNTHANALHYLAIAYNVEHTNVAKLLIEQGVSLDDREHKNRYQPIHVATIQGKNELVKLFLDHGADVNSRADGGVTPLHLAAGCQNPTVLITLLKRGANIDLSLNNGRTALHEALVKACDFWAHNNLGENIKILIAAGADICVEDDTGRTPYSVMHPLFAVDVGFNLDENIRDFLIVSGFRADLNDDTCNLLSGRMMLKILALKKSEGHPSIKLKDELRIQKSGKYWNYYQGCLEQINRLKFTRFIRSCTLFEILSKCHCEIAALMWNHEFKKKFSLCDLNVFPTYAKDICESFVRAERHYLSMVKQKDLINAAVYNGLPYVIVRKIIGYIICEECDLKKIVQASRSSNLGLD